MMFFGLGAPRTQFKLFFFVFLEFFHKYRNTRENGPISYLTLLRGKILAKTLHKTLSNTLLFNDFKLLVAQDENSTPGK